MDLTQEYLKSILRYDPETGVFTWITMINNRAKIGSIAGTLDSVGHRQIRINRKRYFAHRLAFLYMTGEWPKAYVDHIDNSMDNNAWSNLRQASAGQNQICRPIDSRNTSGFKGVSWSKRHNKWVAGITHNQKRLYIGVFSSAEAAHEAYLEAVDKYFGREFRYK